MMPPKLSPHLNHSLMVAKRSRVASSAFPTSARCVRVWVCLLEATRLCLSALPHLVLLLTCRSSAPRLSSSPTLHCPLTPALPVPAQNRSEAARAVDNAAPRATAPQIVTQDHPPHPHHKPCSRFQSHPSGPRHLPPGTPAFARQPSEAPRRGTLRRQQQQHAPRKPSVISCGFSHDWGNMP